MINPRKKDSESLYYPWFSYFLWGFWGLMKYELLCLREFSSMEEFKEELENKLVLLQTKE